MEAQLKVVIDRSACCGYGTCVEICPEVFKLDANGIVELKTDMVPVGLEKRAKEAADACPQSAIVVKSAI